MARSITLDFETRSILDVKTVGPYRYFEHPSTRPLCVAVRMGDRRGLFYDMANMPEWVLDALADPDVEVHAHNAAFERLCIKMVCGPRYGWPVPKGKRYQCSAARARRLALPAKLENLGPALDIASHFLKDKEGHKIMLRLMKPRPNRKGTKTREAETGINWDDDPAKLERVGQYCEQDVEAEITAESRMLPMTEEDIADYQFTEKLNDRGVRIDVNLIRRLVWRTVEATAELDAKMQEATDGKVRAVTNVAALKKWVEDETGVVLDTMRKEDMADLVGEANARGLPKYVVRALVLRQEGGKSSNSKLLKALDRVSRDGRLRGEFVYHGASTGRYTSMGVQLQNLIRDCLKDFDKDIRDLDNFTLTQITLAIRGCFIPAEGHVFVDADYSAIEARGVAWLAGCETLLDHFRNGRDTYCEMGTVIYRRPITEADDPWERFVGKQTILGCGYGMGVDKFMDQCVKFGKPVDRETAERAVGSYRDEYHEIPTLWRDMERAAVAATKDPGRTFSIPNGLVSFRVAHDYLQMRLPSGRRLFYKDARVQQRMKFGKMRDVLTFMGIHPKTKQWARETTWGGTLTENAVQAISRDILFRAMRQMEEEHIPIVLSVHDQVIAEVVQIDGPWAVKRVQQIMQFVPQWAKGFPIQTKPKLAMRFGK